MPIIADVHVTEGPTLDEIIDEIVSLAHGLAIAPDRVVTLSADITDSALTMTIDGDVSPGVFEIGDELIYVTAVEATSGLCTIHPRGRGWQGSTAAAHTAGDVVVDSPALARHRAKTLLNDTIRSMHPAVYGVATATGVLGSASFELAVDAEAVLDVRVLDDDGQWQRVRRWEAENAAEDAASGRVVRIPGVAVDRTVRVVYAVRPEPLATGSQQWSDTGLALPLKEVAVTGVLARFTRVLDVGRLTDRFATPRGDAQQPQLGAGFAMSRQLQADYQAALDREAAALRNLYPARTHFVR